MDVSVSKFASKTVLEMSFGTDERMIGFLAGMMGVVALQNTFLISVQCSCRRIKIEPVTGVGSLKRQEIGTQEIMGSAQFGQQY
ncbi:MAG: hypothetical protein A2W80_18730 [Candidatus Riflebacteria bacterium GWC2_50_8]|nr:MAG: hypothetical protein A2W80_18730 [Candidatus Riflebacteria bacterium GWC2_50_8]